jgi:hypothetical protein
MTPTCPGYTDCQQNAAYKEAEANDFDREQLHDEDPDKTLQQGCRELEWG